MSFQTVPSLFRIPEAPVFDPPSFIWRGCGSDEGYFGFYSTRWNGNVIVRERNLCPSLVFKGQTFRPVFTDVNGYIYWEGAGQIYFSYSYGWVWCNKFPGYEPIENYESQDGKAIWTGDRFYTCASLPYSGTSKSTMIARGSIYDEADEPLTAIWPRWKAKSGEFGVYEGVDGESGEKVLGLPRFRSGGEYFIRSYAKTAGYYTYGRIHRSGGKWVIGEVGSPAGWHEGSEPDTESPVTFRFVKNPESDAVGNDMTVSFVNYVRGEESGVAYLGSVAVWR